VGSNGQKPTRSPRHNPAVLAPSTRATPFNPTHTTDTITPTTPTRILSQPYLLIDSYQEKQVLLIDSYRKMTTTGTFDATTTQLPAPLSVPEASHSIPSNTNTWTSWLYNLFTTPNSNQTPTTGTGRNLLEESDLNASWVAIPSQEDIIMATKTKFERMERLQELTSISDAARSLKKLAQSEITYTRLFGSPFLSHEELIACQNPLEPNTRSAIISKLLHWYSGSYLKTLQRIYFSPENADASVSSWDVFADQFMETKYRKGVIGSMKDIAVLIYHGTSEKNANYFLLSLVMR
jgi:hypothetical protein